MANETRTTYRVLPSAADDVARAEKFWALTALCAMAVLIVCAIVWVLTGIAEIGVAGVVLFTGFAFYGARRTDAILMMGATAATEEMREDAAHQRRIAEMNMSAFQVESQARYIDAQARLAVARDTAHTRGLRLDHGRDELPARPNTQSVAGVELDPPKTIAPSAPLTPSVIVDPAGRAIRTALLAEMAMRWPITRRKFRTLGVIGFRDTEWTPCADVLEGATTRQEVHWRLSCVRQMQWSLLPAPTCKSEELASEPAGNHGNQFSEPGTNDKHMRIQ